MEFIDNHPVIDCRVRFRLRTTVDDEHTSAVRDGETIIWIVRARCLPPQYFEVTRDSDERYKLCIQDVEDAVPLSSESRQAAVAFLDGGRDQLMLPFGEIVTTPLEDSEGNEVSDLRLLLDDFGGIHDGETLADAVYRLINNAMSAAQTAAPQNHSLVHQLSAVPRAAGDPEPIGPTEPPVDGDIEVVGSIYPRGHSPLAALLEEKFGES